MTQYIALLRGINVGGHRSIKMQALRELLENKGFQGVKTYIQSGNVLFHYADSSAGELAQQLQSLILQAFGFDVPVVIRTRTEWKQISQFNPFLDEGPKDFTNLSVNFLQEKPDLAAIADLANIQSASDRFVVHGREIYMYFPNGSARTKLTHQVFEKRLKQIATARNWKTIQKLEAMCEMP